LPLLSGVTTRPFEVVALSVVVMLTAPQ
jgi:hypothetical protein